MAPGFENYEIMNLRFEFVPRVPTTFSGMIYLGIDYDAADVVDLQSEA